MPISQQVQTLAMFIKSNPFWKIKGYDQMPYFRYLKRTFFLWWENSKQSKHWLSYMQFWLVSNQLHDIPIMLQGYVDFYYHVSSDKSRTSNKRRTVSQSGQIKYLILIRAPGYLWCIFFSPYSSFVCHKLVCLYYFVVFTTTTGKLLFRRKFHCFFFRYSPLHLKGCTNYLRWI